MPTKAGDTPMAHINKQGFINPGSTLIRVTARSADGILDGAGESGG